MIISIYSCNEDASSYTVCGTNATGIDSINGTQMIPGTDVLQQLDVTLPFYAIYLMMAGIGVIFRILAYFALRFLHRKHQ